MKGIKVFVILAALLLVVVLFKNLLAEQHGAVKPPKGDVIQKTQKLQMPFIVNEGQTDERVAFYARTFGGTVFVTKDGEIVYSLPKYEQKAEEGGKYRNKETGDNYLYSPQWILWSNETRWHGQTVFARESTEKTNNDLCTPNVVRRGSSLLACSNVDQVERIETQQIAPTVIANEVKQSSHENSHCVDVGFASHKPTYRTEQRFEMDKGCISHFCTKHIIL